MNGPKVDYDFECEPYARRHIEILKWVATLPWWKRIIIRKHLRDLPASAKASYFAVRNPVDSVTLELEKEYRKATGRYYNALHP